MIKELCGLVVDMLPLAKGEKDNAIFCINDSLNVGGGYTIEKIQEYGGINVDFIENGNVVVFFGKDIEFINCKVVLKKDNIVIIRHSEYKIRNLMISALRSDTVTYIGEDFYCGSVDLLLKEKKGIYIGDDCMFSTGISVLNSDMHTITDREGNCINQGGDVIIGNHVWIGQNVEILKGAVVQDNSIIGAGAIVTSKFSEGNVCIAGNPARITRKNCNWDRRSPENYKVGR